MTFLVAFIDPVIPAFAAQGVPGGFRERLTFVGGRVRTYSHGKGPGKGQGSSQAEKHVCIFG